jgi:hypothetical protein
MAGMVPELRKEMQGCDNGNHLCRNTQEGGRQEEESEDAKENGDALTQCTGKIEFLAAVVDDVVIPEDIVSMSDAMDPVSGKVEGHECDEVCPKTRINMKYRQVLQHPPIGNDHNTQSEDILGDVRDAGAQARDHVKVPDRIISLVPAVPFFNKNEY